MASSSSTASGVPTDVYDIDCVPRFTDFTSPSLDHDETIGDKWFELQEQQLSEKEPTANLWEQDENRPPVVEITSSSPEPLKQQQQQSVPSLVLQEENEPPVLENKTSSPMPVKVVPLLENTRNSSPAHTKSTVASATERGREKSKRPTVDGKYKSPSLGSKPPVAEGKYKSPSLCSKPPVVEGKYKSPSLSSKPPVAESKYKSPSLSSKPSGLPTGRKVDEPSKKTTIVSSSAQAYVRKSPAPMRPIPSSSSTVVEERKPPVQRITPKTVEQPKSVDPPKRTAVPSPSLHENMRKSPAPKKPMATSSHQEATRKSPLPKKMVPSCSVQESKPAEKLVEVVKKEGDAGHSTVLKKESDRGRSSILKKESDPGYLAALDDKKCAVRRNIVPQAFSFATDERIKRRSVSRDAVRTSVGPPTTPSRDRRLLPFNQGLRQYEKPTGSPARKPLTLPQPFHFHELKPREKKEDESQHQQPPMIKGKPPVPPNAMRTTRAPMRVVQPMAPATDAEHKQKEHSAVGAPPARRTVRRSVSATNIRTDSLQPFAANCLRVGANSLRSSLNGSTSSLNNGVLDKVEQGATHGLPVIAKDRSRSRQRGSRR